MKDTENNENADHIVVFTTHITNKRHASRMYKNHYITLRIQEEKKKHKTFERGQFHKREKLIS